MGTPSPAPPSGVTSDVPGQNSPCDHTMSALSHASPLTLSPESSLTDQVHAAAAELVARVGEDAARWLLEDLIAKAACPPVVVAVTDPLPRPALSPCRFPATPSAVRSPTTSKASKKKPG